MPHAGKLEIEMKIVSFIEKLRLFKNKVYDLHNVDLKQLEALTEVLALLKEESDSLKIAMSRKAVLEVLFAAHKNMLSLEMDRYFLIDQETLCKLILEINDFKEERLEEVKKQLVVQADTVEEKDMTQEQLIAALKCKIIVLEEDIHALKMEKTIILPTEDFYRTKKEYDALRDRLNTVVAEKNNMVLELSELRREISELQVNRVNIDNMLNKK